MVRRVVVAMDVPGAAPEACFELASATWVYEAVHTPHGDMIDVVPGDWAAPGEATLPKKAAAPRWGRPRSAPEPAAGGGPGPLEEAERYTSYRVPPHFADGWLSKLCPSLTIVEHHTRASRACAASGGRVTVASAVRWSRVAAPAPVMDYTFDISPITMGENDAADGETSQPQRGTRIVYAAEIEVRVPVPLPSRARAAIEDSMVDSFDTLCDRFIRYAAAKLGTGEPVRVRGAGGRSSSDSFDGGEGSGSAEPAAQAPSTPRLTINTGATAPGESLWRRTSVGRRASIDGGDLPPTPSSARRRVSVDLKYGATFVEGDVFYDAREE